MSIDISSLKSFVAISETGQVGENVNMPNVLKRKDSRRESNVSFNTSQGSASILMNNMRRRSTLKSVTSGIVGLLRSRRMTVAKLKIEEPKIKYENSYRLEPEKNKLFSERRIQQMAEEILRNHLENATYNEATCGRVACIVADAIKTRVKEMDIPRYRIVCHVIITEEGKHGMEISSMSVWNDKTDNYASAAYRNGSINAVAMIHGIYLE